LRPSRSANRPNAHFPGPTLSVSLPKPTTAPFSFSYALHARTCQKLIVPRLLICMEFVAFDTLYSLRQTQNAHLYECFTPSTATSFLSCFTGFAMIVGFDERGQIAATGRKTRV